MKTTYFTLFSCVCKIITDWNSVDKISALSFVENTWKYDVNGLFLA